MWRLRSLLVVGIVAIVLLVGTVVVYAGEWWWNAQINVEGADVRTQWTVDTGGTNDYHADIEVRLPLNADAALVSRSVTETAVIERIGSLKCESDGVEARVRWRVTPLGTVAEDSEVQVTITSDGSYVDSDTGGLGKWLELQVLLPIANPACYAGDGDGGRQ